MGGDFHKGKEDKSVPEEVAQMVKMVLSVMTIKKSNWLMIDNRITCAKEQLGHIVCFQIGVNRDLCDIVYTGQTSELKL